MAIYIKQDSVHLGYTNELGERDLAQHLQALLELDAHVLYHLDYMQSLEWLQNDLLLFLSNN